MVIERPVYEMEELNAAYKYEEPYPHFKARCIKTCKSIFPKPSFKKTIPLFDWFPDYKWKQWILGDVVAGMTLAVLQLPQAMACGVLADVPPVNGIYTSIFPIVVYFIFGSSKHISIGTFAVTSLMTGAVVTEHMSIRTEANLTKIMLNSHLPQYTDVEVAQTVTFTVAVIELSMYILHLGIVSQLLSDTFLNAFTCAAAYHIVNSQIRDLIGIPTQKRRGNFAIPLTMYDISITIAKANFVAMGTSLASCTFLLLNNFLFKPWLSKKTIIPFPAELVVVLIITICSKILNFNKNYNVTIVGTIPTGFPKLSNPKFELIPSVLLDSFIITIVGYAISISLALLFARKCLYEVDPNQEFLALGLSNIFGAFTLCIPASASLSRTVLRFNAGGQTQLASVVSSIILVMVILFVAPLFEALPRCILASIIIVALTELLLKVKSIGKYWRLSKWDFTIWIVTFLVTFIVHISYGIMAGIITSLLVLCIQGFKPHTCILGIVPNTDLYLDVEKYKMAEEIDGVKIFHYSGGLNFAITNNFKNSLTQKTGFDPIAVLRKRAKLNKRDLPNQELINITIVILDFSSVTYVDAAGVNFLRILWEDYQRINVQMIITGCLGPIFEMIVKCHRVEKKEKNILLFPTVHDAVLYAQVNILLKNK